MRPCTSIQAYCGAYSDVRRDLQARKKERGLVDCLTSSSRGRGKGRGRKGEAKKTVLTILWQE